MDEPKKRPDESYQDFLERVGVDVDVTIVHEDPKTATVIFFGRAAEDHEAAEPER